MSTAAILLRIIDRPRKAMDVVVERPRSWWLAAVLVVLSTLVLSWASAPLRAELAVERSEKMLERFAAQLPEERLQVVRERLQEQPPLRTALTSAAVAVVLGGIGWLVRGGLSHFCGMAIGGVSAWLPTFAVGVWSLLPFVVRDLVQSAFVLWNGELIEHTGVSVLVATGDWATDARNPLYLVLSQVDPFVLWHLIVLGAGIAAATKLSPAKAAFLALLVWALMAAVKVGVSLLGATVTGGLLGK